MRHKQVLIISFFLIITISASVYYSTRKASVKDRLKKIPLQEQQQLYDFFEALILHNPFGYTIFGDKPVSTADFGVIPHYSELTLFNNSALIIRKYALVWQKYQHLFPLKNFALKCENNGDIISVIIINIPIFKNKVNEHIDLFKKIIGDDITPESLLKTILKQDSLYEDIIKHNEILIGILYGFGRQNSILYNRFIEISNAIEEISPPPFKDNYDYSESIPEHSMELYTQPNRTFKKEKSSRKITPSEGFRNIQEELEFLDAKTGRNTIVNNTYLNHSLAHFKLPRFRYDSHDKETKEIMDSFIKTREKLRQIYSSGEFLEKTLKKLTGET